VFMEDGVCLDEAMALHYPSVEDWPGPNTGIALAANGDAWTGQLVPVCWFAVYNYAEGDTIAITENPATGHAGWISGETRTTYDAECLGALGLGVDGVACCPSGGLDGMEGNEELEGPGQSEDESGGESAYTPYVAPANPSAIVTVYIDPSAIDFGDRNSVLPVESVNLNRSALRESLIRVGARSVAPQYPLACLADTIGYDTNGRRVRLPDISSFYLLEFDDPDAAIRAIPSLQRTIGIEYADVLSADVPVVMMTPNDPYYDSWPGDPAFSKDAQWFLKNDGERDEGDCDPAEAGADIQVESAWSRGLGDSATVIGMVDTGIFGGDSSASCHEDLRVVPLSRAQRALISSHPDLDWCETHGTLMAGLAAAKTNTENAVGVAGICGNCSLLDIETSSCSNEECAAHSVRCQRIAGWDSHVAAALDRLSLGPLLRLRVLNMSVGSGTWLTAPEALTLWRAFLRGVILVASAGDKDTTFAVTGAPQNVPFVLGVGGSTWNGRFWCEGTSCYYPSENGTPAGYSEVSRFGGQGGSLVDVCAPASGPYLTTNPIVQSGSSGYYWYTTGQTSGASAQVAGAAGLIQSLARERFGQDLPADDIIGIIEAAATPWSDPHPSTYAECDTCSPEYFGHGILNVENAAALVTELADFWRADWDSAFCEHVVGRYGDIEPGSWQFTLVDSGTAPNGKRCREYKAQAQVRIPSIYDCGPMLGREDLANLPGRMAWVRRTEPHTNTYGSYGDYFWTRVEMKKYGITDCRLSLIDQETGLATISGYSYACCDSGDTTFHFEPPEDSVRMAYVDMCRCCPIAVEESASPDVEPPLQLAGHQNPTRPPVSLSLILHQPGAVQIVILDVGGRRVRTMDLGRLENGVHEVTWDGTSSRGEPAPAGVYWIQARVDGNTLTKRLVSLGH
jgi:hypothetical protein